MKTLRISQNVYLFLVDTLSHHKRIKSPAWAVALTVRIYNQSAFFISIRHIVTPFVLTINYRYFRGCRRLFFRKPSSLLRHIPEGNNLIKKVLSFPIFAYLIVLDVILIATLNNERVIASFTVVALYLMSDSRCGITCTICISQNKTLCYVEHRLLSKSMVLCWLIRILYITLYFN